VITTNVSGGEKSVGIGGEYACKATVVEIDKFLGGVEHM
jgi:hypothetical protein